MINNIHRALTANKKFYSLLALCAFLFIPNAAKATDYTIFPNADVASYALPLSYFHQTYAGSVTQQIYWAEELTDQGASAGNINSITFYYTAAAGTTASAYSRNVQIYLMEVANTVDEYSIENNGTDYVSHFLYNNSTNKAGTKVYEGALSTQSVTASNPINLSTDVRSVTIPITAFPWDGSKNIVMTVADVTNTAQSSTNLRFLIASTKISTTNYPRFAYTKWTAIGNERLGWINDFSGNSKWADKYGYTTTTYNTEAGQKSQRSYVNKVTFSISVTIPAPTNLAASSITTSSATLSWNAAAGATGYNVRWGKTSGSLDHSQNNVAATSLAISGLDDGETYYFDVQTITAGGTSAWASEANFNTTAITHIHDGISFSKWASTTTMPTSGNYYLNDDVAFDIMSSDVTLTGNLNLCLNGHTADLYGSKIIVPDGKTLAIYDNVGGGKLTGFVASDVGIADTYAKALIVVRSGGELELHQGTIENTYIPDGDGSSYAIYSNGTIHLSGSVLINSNNTDIYLYSSNVIILDGAISNAEKHKVYKMGGEITYGWSTYMSGEDPRDYFESSNSARAVFLDDDEAALRILLRLSENSNNSAIESNRDIVIDVALTRSLTSSQYNTFCLPFNLNNAQLEAIFGVGYDLREFDHSNFDGETLELVFVQRTSLTEGAPYLIKPSVDVVNPYFEGVTIYDGNPGSDEFDANIHFHSTFAPTELEGGNKNLLFLGANNELFWPESTGNLKAFRAYFEVKGEARKAVHARISKHEDTATGIDQINEKMEKCENAKIIKDGQLFILRDNKTYNVLGLECK